MQDRSLTVGFLGQKVTVYVVLVSDNFFPFCFVFSPPEAMCFRDYSIKSSIFKTLLSIF